MLDAALCKKQVARLGIIAMTLLCGGGVSPPKETKVFHENPYWELAWRAANTISSPIDAGTTKAQLCNAAALCGRAGLIERWKADEPVLWVKLTCDVARAYAEALFGNAEKHEMILQATVHEAASVDEWDQMRITTPLLKAYIAGLWQKSQDFQMMKKWIFEDDVKRILGDDVKRLPAAALVFCDWMTLLQQRARGDIAPTPNLVAIMDMLMEQRQKFATAERLRMFASLSPLLRGSRWDSTVQQEPGEVEKTTPKPDCETLLEFSRIYAGLGKKDRADRLITRAQKMIEAKDTGDCLAPWALLAEAKRAAGRSREEVNQTFEEGISHSNDRPGYFKPVAEALTYATRAQYETQEK